MGILFPIRISLFSKVCRNSPLNTYITIRKIHEEEEYEERECSQEVSVK